MATAPEHVPAEGEAHSVIPPAKAHPDPAPAPKPAPKAEVKKEPIAKPAARKVSPDERPAHVAIHPKQYGGYDVIDCEGNILPEFGVVVEDGRLEIVHAS